MKTFFSRTNAAIIIATSALWAGLGTALADDPLAPQPPAGALPANGNANTSGEVVWLGVTVEEAPEAVCAQLNLKTGEGLTAAAIAEGSPAAEADIHTNDVLVDFDGQMLVDPHQLSKLVRMHAEGETAKLTFYRGGKKRTVEVKLARTALPEVTDPTALAMPGNAPIFLQRDPFKTFQPNLQQPGALKNLQQNFQFQLQGPNGAGMAGASSGAKMVQSDDTGTYSVEIGAKKHLTAHDKNGKLLFDGDISTPAEQKKVPKKIWEKVKPMMDGAAGPVANQVQNALQMANQIANQIGAQAGGQAGGQILIAPGMAAPMIIAPGVNPLQQDDKAGLR